MQGILTHSFRISPVRMLHYNIHPAFMKTRLLLSTPLPDDKF